MNLIAAVDKNWGIGNKGDLLVRIPLDQQMFRKDTLGKICIMGRKEYMSAGIKKKSWICLKSLNRKDIPRMTSL